MVCGAVKVSAGVRGHLGAGQGRSSERAGTGAGRADGDGPSGPGLLRGLKGAQGRYVRLIHTSRVLLLSCELWLKCIRFCGVATITVIIPKKEEKQRKNERLKE